MNMKHCGRRNVRKQKEIKGIDKIVTLDISSNFDSLNNMKTTKVRSQKYEKARYSIGNVSEKDLSKIIIDFEKIGKLPYEKKSCAVLTHYVSVASARFFSGTVAPWESTDTIYLCLGCWMVR